VQFSLVFDTDVRASAQTKAKRHETNVPVSSSPHRVFVRRVLARELHDRHELLLIGKPSTNSAIFPR